MKQTYTHKTRLKTVTRCPIWLLRIKGQLDSKKGEGVCDEFIKTLEKRLIVLESKETMKAESALKHSRERAATLLTDIDKQASVIKSVTFVKENSIEDIRQNRKMALVKANASQKHHIDGEELMRINEQIINTHTLLDERINALRSQMTSKVHGYIKGVRSKALKDYHYQINEEDSARSIYHDKHKHLDQAVYDMSLSLMAKEVRS